MRRQEPITAAIVDKPVARGSTAAVSAITAGESTSAVAHSTTSCQSDASSMSARTSVEGVGHEGLEGVVEEMRVLRHKIHDFDTAFERTHGRAPGHGDRHPIAREVARYKQLRRGACGCVCLCECVNVCGCACMHACVCVCERERERERERWEAVGRLLCLWEDIHPRAVMLLASFLLLDADRLWQTATRRATALTQARCRPAITACWTPRWCVLLNVDVFLFCPRRDGLSCCEPPLTNIAQVQPSEHPVDVAVLLSDRAKARMASWYTRNQFSAQEVCSACKCL
jgi:hypothetical protein